MRETDDAQIHTKTSNNGFYIPELHDFRKKLKSAHTYLVDKLLMRYIRVGVCTENHCSSFNLARNDSNHRISPFTSMVAGLMYKKRGKSVNNSCRFCDQIVRLPRFSMRPENRRLSFGERNFDHFVFSEARGTAAASLDST